LLHQLHNKVVGASTLLFKCFYGNDREEFVTDGHFLPLIILVAKLDTKKTKNSRKIFLQTYFRISLYTESDRTPQKVTIEPMMPYIKYFSRKRDTKLKKKFGSH
jgi:hypothetical protein